MIELAYLVQVNINYVKGSHLFCINQSIYFFDDFAKGFLWERGPSSV